jgi:hypothetical protein
MKLSAPSPLAATVAGVTRAEATVNASHIILVVA